jgi:hypothetical protein
MKRNFCFNGKSIEYHRIDFILNETTQRYEKQPMIKDFKKIATDLKIEETHDPKIKMRSKYLLRGRTVNGKCTFHLGLENSTIPMLYRSALDDKKKSEVHIVFLDDFKKMKMYVFNSLRLLPPTRRTFQEQFILHLNDLGEWLRS